LVTETAGAVIFDSRHPAAIVAPGGDISRLRRIEAGPSRAGIEFRF
jgi:hypothetical protein